MNGISDTTTEEPTVTNENQVILAGKEWTVDSVEEAARARGTTPEGRLLAIFDVFDGWFHSDDYEALSFMDVMLELVHDQPRKRVAESYVAHLRDAIRCLAAEANLRDIPEFVLSWRVLMRGSICNAVEGDEKASSRAKGMGRDLIAHHRRTIQARPAASSTPDDPRYVDFDFDGFFNYFPAES